MTRLLRQSHMTGQFSVRRSTFGSSEHALYHVVVCKTQNGFRILVTFCQIILRRLIQTIACMYIKLRLPPVSVLTKPAMVIPSPLLLPR